MGCARGSWGPILDLFLEARLKLNIMMFVVVYVYVLLCACVCACVYCIWIGMCGRVWVDRLFVGYFKTTTKATLV